MGDLCLCFSSNSLICFNPLYIQVKKTPVKNNVAKITVVTGKGTRSKVEGNPYLSKDLSILKYSIPNFIKNNSELMDKILNIDESAVASPAKGNFEIVLKKNE